MVTPCRVKVQWLVDMPQAGAIDPRPPLGCEVGIKGQFTLSTGIEYPKQVRDLSAVKRVQRRFSRAVKGSKRRRKQRALLAKAWQRV